jgi:hypothetical protein
MISEQLIRKGVKRSDFGLIGSTIPACLHRLGKIMKNMSDYDLIFEPRTFIYNVGIQTTQPMSCLKTYQGGGRG